MRFGTVQKIIGESVRSGAFTLYSAPGGRGVAASPWPEELPPPTEAAAFFAFQESITAKRTAKMEASVRDGFFFKRYRRRGLWEACKNRFRSSRPEKVLAAALTLRGSGLMVPEVVLAGQEGGDGILLTRALPVSAKAWNTLAMTLTQEKPLEDFLSKSAAALAAMHRLGLAHGDFNLRNLFDENGTLWIIDWDGVAFYPARKSVPLRVRQKEMARLISSLFRCWFHGDRATTAAERRGITARFVRKYAEKSGLDIAGEALDRRVEYLTCRLRKDGADDWLKAKMEKDS